MKVKPNRLPARAAISAVALAGLLAGCGGGGGGYDLPGVPPPAPTPAPTPAPGPTIDPNTVYGKVVANITTGATVNIYAVNADGSYSTSSPLGSATTDSTGSFQIKFTTLPSGPIALVATGGSYTSEADTTKTIDFTGGTLVAIVPSVTGKNSGLTVTPISTFVANYVQAQSVALGSISKAATSADSAIKTLYGLTGSVTDPNYLGPDYTVAGYNTDAGKLALMLGGLEQLSLKSGLKQSVLFSALAQDFSDGVFDGKAASGKAVTINGVAIDPGLGTTQFLAALNAYVQSTAATALSAAGIPAQLESANVATSARSIAHTAGLTANITANNAGAMATMKVTRGGVPSTLLFVAAKTSGLITVDITDPTVTSPSVNTNSSLNTSILKLMYPNGGSSLTVDGVVGVPTAGQVALYSYTSKIVVLVDATTSTVSSTIDLSNVITGTASFSGGTAYISGGIADPYNNAFWLASGNGYIEIDLARSAYKQISAYSSGTYAPENIGGAATLGMLFSPFYSRGGTGLLGVDWVDTNSGQTYRLPSPFFSSSGAFSTFEEPDGGGVDSAYGVGVTTNEHTNTFGLLNFGLRSDGTAGKNFTFANGLFIPNDGTSSSSTSAYVVSVDLTPDATDSISVSSPFIDSTTHLFMAMDGNGTSDVLVGLLQDPSQSNWSTQPISAYSYGHLSNLFESAVDPHAAAVINNGGKAYGYLLSTGTTITRTILQVDLQAYLNARKAGLHAINASGAPSTYGVKTITW